jgi:hypothetical protein
MGGFTGATEGQGELTGVTESGAPYSDVGSSPSSSPYYIDVTVDPPSQPDPIGNAIAGGLVSGGLGVAADGLMQAIANEVAAEGALLTIEGISDLDSTVYINDDFGWVGPDATVGDATLGGGADAGTSTGTDAGTSTGTDADTSTDDDDTDDDDTDMDEEEDADSD